MAEEHDEPVEWELTAVILVAVVGELREVYDALGESSKEVEATDDPDIHRVFYLQQGKVLLRILFAKLPDPAQGGDAAAVMASRLAQRYEPYFLGMIGMCAGNPSLTDLGDVVVSSGTVRHDYGKLTRRFVGKVPMPLLRLAHRVMPIRIDPALSRELVVQLAPERGNLAAEARRSDFSIQFGTISTCNQVTTVERAFDYLEREVNSRTAGDEPDRKIVGLEMEAHAVAYAANHARVPLWLIVKGVVDFASPAKTDGHQAAACRNAANVTQGILRETVVRLFLRHPERRQAEKCEEASIQAIQGGFLTKARDEAIKAYRLHRRSAGTRNRVLHGMTQFGKFEEARDLIEVYRNTGFLYDATTIKREASMLWRTGKYDESIAVLSDERVQSEREVLYLQAMNQVFSAEDLGGGRPSGSSHLTRARDLLQRALRIEKPRVTPWWIQVNLFWVLRLLGEEHRDQYATALASLDRVIDGAPEYGMPRLYRLALFAFADDREKFDAELNTMVDSWVHIELALDSVDMVYHRLEVLGDRKIVDHGYYWTELCRWLLRTRTVGTTARESTARRIQGPPPGAA